jgi:hypothetical protein
MMMERQDLMQVNEKSRIVLQTMVAENVKVKGHNQILLKEKEQVISMNTKLIADQRILEDLSRYWQSEEEEMHGRIDWTASESEQLCSENR